MLASVVFVATMHLVFIATPLGIDQAGVSLVGERMFNSHDHGRSLYGDLWLDRPPLTVLIYGIADAVGGSIGVRLAGLVAGVAIVVVSCVAARRLGFAHAAPFVAVVAALLASSPALGSSGAPQELFAALLVIGAVATVAPALRSLPVGAWSWIAAGTLAASALLVKQSFLDGLVACIVIAVLAPATRRRRATAAALLFAGAAVPIAMMLGWAILEGPGAADLTYAMVGFRLDAAEALAHASTGMGHRFLKLGLGSFAAGMVVLLPVAAEGLVRIVRSGDRHIAVFGAAWLGAGLVGVIGGGYYWSHYLIQLLPATAIFGGVGLHSLARMPRVRATLIVTFVALVAGSSAAAYSHGGLNVHQHESVDVAGFLRTNSSPTDRLFVLYSRANLSYEARMTPAFPYLWSLMYRTIPDVEPRLRRLLASPDRPTWIVGFQPTDAFGLDRSGATRRLIAREYRVVAVVCDKPVLLRRDDHRSLVDPHVIGCAG